MEIQEGTLTLYPFGYRDYLLAKKNKPSEAQEKTQKPKEAKQPSASRLSPKRLEREKAKVLEEIHLLEEEKTKAQEGLKDEKNADDWEKLAALQDEIAQIDSKLSELYEVWLELEEASS
jgi:PAB1-binding protein PBP1